MSVMPIPTAWGDISLGHIPFGAARILFPTAFFKEIDPLVVDSPAYHDILADGLGGGDQGVNERCPPFL